MTHPRPALRSVLALALVFCAACATPESDASPGIVRRWGTLREALRDGQTEGRVDVASVAAPGVFGVGAVAGLDGEITVVDGQLLVSRVRSGRVETERPTRVQATLFAAAAVTGWHDVPVTADVDPSVLDAFVADQAAQAGIDTSRPFPFVVDGPLRHLHLHVIAGECPIRARMLGHEMRSPPYKRHYEQVRGSLVGIYARDAVGVLTHHGATTHVHAVVDDGETFTAHVETVGLAAGSVLRLPTRSAH